MTKNFTLTTHVLLKRYNYRRQRRSIFNQSTIQNIHPPLLGNLPISPKKILPLLLLLQTPPCGFLMLMWLFSIVKREKFIDGCYYWLSKTERKRAQRRVSNKS